MDTEQFGIEKELNLAFLINFFNLFLLGNQVFYLLLFLYRCALLFYNVVYLLEIDTL